MASEPSEIQPALTGGVAHQLGAGLEPELFQAARLVGLDRFDADVEPRGDFLVGEAERGHLQYVRLAVGQCRGNAFARRQPLVDLFALEYPADDRRIDVEPAD